MGALQVSIEKIEVRPQARKVFDEVKMEELTDSVRLYGVIEPLIVRGKSGKDAGYVLRAGERRLRAAIRAGLDKVPVLVRNEDAATGTMVQLVENLQREEMNDMDLGEAFQKVMDEHRLSVADLAKQVGKSESYITQRTRLLKAAPEVQEALRSGKIDFGGARTLCGMSKDEQVEVLNDAIIEEAAARRKRAEKKPVMEMLPEAAAAAEAAAEMEEEEDEEEESDPKAAAGPRRKPKKSKVTTRSIKNAARRKRNDSSQVPALTEKMKERLEEKTKEWVSEFIDMDTKGSGLDETLSAIQARNLLKRYSEFLGEKRILIVR